MRPTQQLADVDPNGPEFVAMLSPHSIQRSMRTLEGIGCQRVVDDPPLHYYGVWLTRVEVLRHFIDPTVGPEGA